MATLCNMLLLGLVPYVYAQKLLKIFILLVKYGSVKYLLSNAILLLPLKHIYPTIGY